MAEHSFQEVMRQWRRMCVAFEEGCERCPQYREYQCYNTVKRVFEHGDIESLESNVMTWAAEHPEPVYPSWYEYLTDMYLATWNMIKDKSIPADLAEKLGVKPKEG